MCTTVDVTYRYNNIVVVHRNILSVLCVKFAPSLRPWRRLCVRYVYLCTNNDAIFTLFLWPFHLSITIPYRHNNDNNKISVVPCSVARRDGPLLSRNSFLLYLALFARKSIRCNVTCAVYVWVHDDNKMKYHRRIHSCHRNIFSKFYLNTFEYILV